LKDLETMKNILGLKGISSNSDNLPKFYVMLRKDFAVENKREELATE